MVKLTYCKENSKGKLDRARSQEDADAVLVPIADYVSVDEWNDLVKRYNALKDQKDQCRIAAGTAASAIKNPVTISQKEYNGYENALRIIRDRSMQQVDLANADEHGYTLLTEEYRFYRTKSKKSYYAWLITMRTPHSLHIDGETAKFLIKKDLQEFYGFCGLPVIDVGDKYRKTKTEELLKAIIQKHDPGHKESFYVENTVFGQRLKNYIDRFEGPCGFELSSIYKSWAYGVYEVRYWASDEINCDSVII